MRPGDFILEPPTDVYGHLVAAVSGGRYCHVRIVGDHATASAQSDGVVMDPDVYDGDVLVSPPLTEQQRVAIQPEIDRVLGRPYSHRGFLAAGLSRLGLRRLVERVPFIRPTDPLDPPRFICSELIVAIWRRVGFDPFPGRLPSEVTPGDLADEALRRGWGSQALTA